jgi:hypothetical protein
MTILVPENKPALMTLLSTPKFLSNGNNDRDMGWGGGCGIQTEIHRAVLNMNLWGVVIELINSQTNM